MIVPGGNPVTALPGVSPKSPVIVVGPVLVIVLAPKTAKLEAVPRPDQGTTDKAETFDCVVDVTKSREPKSKIVAIPIVAMPFLFPMILLKVVNIFIRARFNEWCII